MLIRYTPRPPFHWLGHDSFMQATHLKFAGAYLGDDKQKFPSADEPSGSHTNHNRINQSTFAQFHEFLQSIHYLVHVYQWRH